MIDLILLGCLMVWIMIGIFYISFGIIGAYIAFSERISREKEVDITENNFIYNRLAQHYQYLIENGYDVVCLCLQGSQNYGLDEYSENYLSDIDSKAIVLPKFEDYINEKSPLSTTIVLENNEHIDVKDIRVMFEQFKKQNISYLEILFTQYKIINPVYKKEIENIFNKRKRIANMNPKQLVKCIAGMSLEKKNALCHPYPATAAKIKKYGFDGKQLSHCVRLNELLVRWLNGESFDECFKSKNRKELMNYKKQRCADGKEILSKEDAEMICAYYDNLTKELKDKFVKKYEKEKNDEKVCAFLDRVKYRILKEKFKREIGD